MAISSPNLSTIQRLRQGVQQRFEADLLARVQGAMATAAASYEVWLFGSRARGDWDGRSDTDLLVVADSQEVADGLADALLDAGCGADVIALSRASWDAKATSESPHWRGIHQQARQLLRVGP
jgi:tRNA nucleotidyltransferase (CCA-adding enzyme)